MLSPHNQIPNKDQHQKKGTGKHRTQGSQMTEPINTSPITIRSRNDKCNNLAYRTGRLTRRHHKETVPIDPTGWEGTIVLRTKNSIVSGSQANKKGSGNTKQTETNTQRNRNKNHNTANRKPTTRRRDHNMLANPVYNIRR